MLPEDVYKTIDIAGEGTYSEKRSKFLAFAIPVKTVEEVKEYVEAYQKKYYDARHDCYAYRLGERVKLGTSGLIVAYRIAAAEALDSVEHIEKTINDEIVLRFPYELLNDVLRVVKEEEPKVVEQVFDNDCLMRLSMRLSRMPRLIERYEKLEIASRGILKIEKS